MISRIQEKVDLLKSDEKNFIFDFIDEKIAIEREII